MLASRPPVNSLLRFVPKNLLSRVVGTLVHIPLPGFLARALIGWFVRRYDIDLSEITRPVESFRSLGAFFVRDLLVETRPVGAEPVSPVDGRLRAFGTVASGQIEQVKNRDYSLEAFLGDSELARQFDGGTFFNLYLSPRDYHHIHAPISGTISRCIHIPGALWPVNDWSLENVSDLFAINERVVVLINTNPGQVAVVMIGATNVGSITVTFDDLTTNDRRIRSKQTRSYSPPIDIRAGARLSTFHMGSSVVVLFEPGRIDLQSVAVAPGSLLRYGGSLLEGS